MSQTVPALSKANLGWLYYKRYYHQVDFSQPDKNQDNEQKMLAVNNLITSFTYTEEHNNAFNKVSERPKHLYYLITRYPGLLSGSGYTHETNRLGETKIGFFFDHITGMPCLPGHSVKGKIRSSFPQWQNKKVKYQEQKQDYILKYLNTVCKVDTKKQYNDYLTSLSVNTIPEYNDKLFVKILENYIFEGRKPSINKTGEWTMKNGEFVYEPIGIYERDIFYDAFVAHGGKDGKIFGMDAITPHEHPLRNPIPLTFIKVLPKVYWKFQFHLKDNIIDAASKIRLFFHLLEEFGVGAKTNVGYGQFENAGFIDIEQWYRAGCPTLWALNVP